MATATFVAADTTTLGNWRGLYGTAGHMIASATTFQPAGATIDITQGSAHAWDANPSADKALQRADGTLSASNGRISSIWFHATNSKSTVLISDGSTKRVSYYFQDGDSGGRAATVNVYDDDTNTLLDSRSVSSTDYAAGYWVTWDCTGPIRVEVVTVSGANVGPAGIFVDPVTPPSGGSGLVQPYFAHDGFVSDGYENPFLGRWDAHGTENVNSCLVIIGGTIRNLKVRLLTAPGGVTTRTFTFRRNGVMQPVTVTIAGSATENSDTTNSFDFAAGDILTVQISSTGSPASSSVWATFEMQHEGSAISMYAFGTPASTNALNDTTPSYESPFGGTEYLWNDFTSVYNVAAVAGSIAGWRIRLTTAPGSGISRVFVLDVNGVQQDGTGGTVDTRITIAGTAVIGEATFTLPVAALDRVRLVASVSGGTASNANAHGTVHFEAATPGQFMWCGSPRTNPGSGTSYQQTFGSTAAWDATEANRILIGPITPIQLSGLYVSTVTAPGSGNAYAFTLRKNAGDTAQTVTVADLNTAAGPSVGAVVDLTTADEFSMQAVASGFPNTTPRWAFLMTDPNVPTGGSGFNALLVSP